jgi:hypothetical protein
MQQKFDGLSKAQPIVPHFFKEKFNIDGKMEDFDIRSFDLEQANMI